MIAIELENVGKAYPRDLTARSILAHILGRAVGKTVFSGINFSIPNGQVVGLIGPNGAGKSTLLRVIAGQAKPTTGVVRTNGRLRAILQIATGLQDDWTGRENIRLLGSLYGMSDADVAAHQDDIVAFAQLEQFIDYPVRTYSAGMRARLAFSIVTSIDCDILLIDEALAVGDVGFAQRCRERMRALCRKGMTAIIVSHSTTTIRELCDRALWLDEGRIVADGPPATVVEDYRLSMLTRAEREFASRYAHRIRSRNQTCDFAVDDLWTEGAHGRAAIIPVGTPFSVHAAVNSQRPLAGIRAELEFLRVDGVHVLRCETMFDLPAGRSIISAVFGPMRLGRFPYECRLTLADATGAVMAERIAVMAVDDQHHSFDSAYYPPMEWQLNVPCDSVPAGDFDC